jgi:hypothetical protein
MIDCRCERGVAEVALVDSKSSQKLTAKDLGAHGLDMPLNNLREIHLESIMRSYGT